MTALRKDNPTASDVHIASAGGSGKRKAKLYAEIAARNIGKSVDADTDHPMRKFVKAETVDQSLGIVLGWAIVCKEDGKDYWDVQKNHIPEDAMLEAAADFMEHSRAGNEMHAGPECGSYVFAFPLTTDIAKAMGVESKRSGLMIGYKPPPDVLAKFVSGAYSGFSIEGFHIELEPL